jgi:hypothetical protein
MHEEEEQDFLLEDPPLCRTVQFCYMLAKEDYSPFFQMRANLYDTYFAHAVDKQLLHYVTGSRVTRHCFCTLFKFDHVSNPGSLTRHSKLQPVRSRLE